MKSSPPALSYLHSIASKSRHTTRRLELMSRKRGSCLHFRLTGNLNNNSSHPDRVWGVTLYRLREQGINRKKKRREVRKKYEGEEKKALFFFGINIVISLESNTYIIMLDGIKHLLCCVNALQVLAALHI